MTAISFISLLDPIYDEAIALALNSKEYFSYYDNMDKDFLSYMTRMQMIDEMRILTIRLTEIVSWAFAIRALHNNEIDAEEIDKKYRISKDEYLLQPYAKQIPLPKEMTELLTKSHILYIRTSRLIDDAVKNLQINNRRYGIAEHA